jgi:hypothetical protein
MCPRGNACCAIRRKRRYGHHARGKARALARLPGVCPARRPCGRLDHTLANIQTLAYLRGRGAKACLAQEGETVTLIENETLRFRAGLSGNVSVFAYGASARGVYERGLRYPLTDAHLTDDFPHGVSNAFTGAPASVSVSDGRLLVIYGAGIRDSDLFSEPSLDTRPQDA